MDDAEVKALKVGDQLALYVGRGSLPRAVTVAEIRDRQRSNADGGRGHYWAIVRDDRGRTHVVESDEYLQSLGYPTHEDIRVMAMTTKKRVLGAELVAAPLY